MTPHKIHLVLLRTEYASNVGAAARALGNMGTGKLILIDKKCEINSQTRQSAAGAQEFLQARSEYPDWKNFLQNEEQGVYIALSARSGHHRSVTSLKQTLTQLQKKCDDTKELQVMFQNIYLILGPEANGLSNEDLDLCHYTCHLPIYGQFKSINLAQAALLALFITGETLGSCDQLASVSANELAPHKEVLECKEILTEWLSQVGMDLHHPKKNAAITLNQMFMRAVPTIEELRVFQSMIQQTIRKLGGSHREP